MPREQDIWSENETKENKATDYLWLCFFVSLHQTLSYLSRSVTKGRVEEEHDGGLQPHLLSVFTHTTVQHVHQAL